MLGYMDKLKQYAGIFGTGLLHQIAPEIVGGIINEFFHQWRVDVDKVIDNVQRNRCIWDELKPEHRRQLNSLAKKVGDLNFITSTMFINSIKKDFPAVASLFLGWPEAMEWLKRQIEELKAQVNNEA